MDVSSRTEADDAGEFTCPVPDRLGVLSATAQVVRHARYLALDRDAVSALAERWALQPWPEQSGLDALHFFDGTAHTVNWVLVLDALNFCFWGEPGERRWQIEWHGQVLDGYNALAAALSRAVERGWPIWEADYLADMREDTLAEILAPTAGSSNIPLFEARLANAREVGHVLRDRYHGEFASAVLQAGRSAVSLVLLLTREFASFRDTATWQGITVPFYKRAQICVADLHTAFAGRDWGTFDDLNQLTAFADYKLPQLLRRYGILVYSSELAECVDLRLPIPAGSLEEIEIRSATIWGVEWLRRELAGRGMPCPSSAIDYRLWSDSQAEAPDARPYHRTRTIYY
jgi:Potential Queuosine, Q, salvage protein family